MMDTEGSKETMTVLLFIGCGLVAFAPPLAFLALVISKRSQLVIVTVTSAFAWLLGILFSAVLWKIIPPFQDEIAYPIIFSVVIQEAMRFGFVALYSKAEKGVADMINVDQLPFNDLSSSMAAGLGFGGMYALVMYGSVLATSLEPADYFTAACPRVSIFVVSAFCSLFMQLLHIALMVVSFDALRRPGTTAWRAGRVALVIAAHFAATLSTLLNSSESAGGCSLGVPLLLLVVCCALGFSACLVRSPGYFFGGVVGGEVSCGEPMRNAREMRGQRRHQANSDGTGGGAGAAGGISGAGSAYSVTTGTSPSSIN